MYHVNLALKDEFIAKSLWQNHVWNFFFFFLFSLEYKLDFDVALLKYVFFLEIPVKNLDSRSSFV